VRREPGHLNCFDCLTFLASNGSSNAVCPCCRQPYSERNITKLFLTFPAPVALPAPTEDEKGTEEPPQQSDLAEPPPLTDDQKVEANELSTRMSTLGIHTDVDELGRVLSDVKLWAAGVGTIGDMETQVRPLNASRTCCVGKAECGGIRDCHDSTVTQCRHVAVQDGKVSTIHRWGQTNGECAGGFETCRDVTSR
jgi:hypothetical protein